MTTEEMAELFDRHSDEYLAFNQVKNKRSRRPDLHAMLVLDALFPGTTCMVSAAEHDEFFLGVGAEELASVATDELVIELTRCGLRYDTSCDALGFFT